MVKRPTTSDATASRSNVNTDLAQALMSNQFFLVYQPTIDLRTSAFAGVEALMRWRHPTLGVLSPNEFLGELEASGQIISVGRWALVTACNQGAQWHAKGYRFTVSVNVSLTQLGHPEFVHDVAIALTSSRFDPELLVLEFSQSVLAEPDHVLRRRLDQLTSLGVHLAIDDFEPGRAPLDELEGFPIDTVKLDRNFIAQITDSAEVASLVHSLVERAKALGVRVVASGIEDAAQRRQLQLVEVSAGQGFHFSAPHEAAEIDRLLQDFAIFSGKPL